MNVLPCVASLRDTTSSSKSRLGVDSCLIWRKWGNWGSVEDPINRGEEDVGRERISGSPVISCLTVVAVVSVGAFCFVVMVNDVEGTFLRLAGKSAGTTVYENSVIQVQRKVCGKLTQLDALMMSPSRSYMIVAMFDEG